MKTIIIKALNSKLIEKFLSERNFPYEIYEKLENSYPNSQQQKLAHEFKLAANDHKEQTENDDWNSLETENWNDEND